MPLNVGSRSKTLLQGAIDTHMHTAPDIYPRSVTVQRGWNAGNLS